MSRQDRIVIVNEIIKTIALNGRGFFFNKKDNDMNYILEKNGRLFMYNSYNKTEMFLHTKYGYPPKEFNHGGTLWCLTKDFKEYIVKGGYANHNNGHGGLYCTYWGYSEEDMKTIQETALRLGYLKPKETKKPPLIKETAYNL